MFPTQLTARQPAKVRGRPQNADRIGRKRQPEPTLFTNATRRQNTNSTITDDSAATTTTAALARNTPYSPTWPTGYPQRCSLSHHASPPSNSHISSASAALRRKGRRKHNTPQNGHTRVHHLKRYVEMLRFIGSNINRPQARTRRLLLQAQP